MRRKTKSIISGIVLVALVAGVLALAVSLLGKDTKSIGSGKFDVGAINAEGVYVKNDRSIYTKDLIECQGLSIEPDFEATGTYQVFYYGANKNFIGSTEVMNAEDGVYNKGTTFPLAKYCRIMITPDVPLDEDGNEEENFKIRFYQVAGYANDYNITVNKKQNYKAPNLFVYDETKVGVICASDSNGRFEERESELGANYVLINVRGLENLNFEYESAAQSYSYCFYDVDNMQVSFGLFPMDETECTIAVPDGAVTMGVIYHPNNIPEIYGE